MDDGVKKMSDKRMPLYYELFFGLAENQKLEQGLQYVANAPESRCSPLVREMALAVLDEMEFFRELRSHPLTLRVYRPRKLKANDLPVVTMDQVAYDPLLQEVAKAVLDEIEFNRGQRKWAQGLLYFVFILCAFGFIAVIGILIWYFH